nr:hypothetical protein [Providencia stuartii]
MSATVRLWRGGQPVNGNGGCSGGASAGLAFPDTSPPALSANRRWCSLELSWVALHALTGI